jgi:hypothetical protein
LANFTFSQLRKHESLLKELKGDRATIKISGGGPRNDKKSISNSKPTSNLSAWLQWARQYADSIDPILLTFPVNEAGAANRDKAEGESEAP